MANVWLKKLPPTAPARVHVVVSMMQNGKDVKLSSFTSGWTKKDVVLYFYPKDKTPGCTMQVFGAARTGSGSVLACYPIRQQQLALCWLIHTPALPPASQSSRLLGGAILCTAAGHAAAAEEHASSVGD